MLLNVPDQTLARLDGEYACIVDLVRLDLIREKAIEDTTPAQTVWELCNRMVKWRGRPKLVLQAGFAVFHAWSWLRGPCEREIQALVRAARAMRDLAQLRQSDDRAKHFVDACMHTGLRARGHPVEDQYAWAREQRVLEPVDSEALTREAARLQSRAELLALSRPLTIGALEANAAELLSVFCFELFVTPFDDSTYGGNHFLRKPESWYRSLGRAREYLSLKEIAVVAGQLVPARPLDMPRWKWSTTRREAADRIRKRVQRIENAMESLRTNCREELVRGRDARIRSRCR